MAVTLRQVERFAVSFGTGDTSKTHTLSTTLLDVDKAFMVFGYAPTGNNSDTNDCAGKITNTTTLTFTRAGSGEVAVIIGYVAEFTAGVTVDHFDTTLPTDGNADFTLTNVTDLSKSFILFSSSTAGSTWGSDDIWVGYLWNDGGTLKARIQSDATTVAASQPLGIQVVQYADCSVQRGSNTTMASGDTSETESISAVTINKSFLMFSFRQNANPKPNTGCLRGRITSTTQLTFDRDASGNAIADIRYEVVSFTGSETVQEVLESFAASDTQENATITEVSGTDKAIAFASSDQRWGKGAYSAADKMGEASFTADLTSTTNLQTRRRQSVSTADACFYVVDFGAAGGGNAPTGTIYGPLGGPLAGPI